MARPATRPKKPFASLQGRHKDQDAEPYATKHACANHQVTYYVPTQTSSTCPVCEAELEIERLRATLTQSQNELVRTQSQLEKLQPQLDIISAIKNALEVTDQGDLMWLKVQMYQYKIDKSVSLKVTHGRLGRGKKDLPPNGFMAIPRHGEPEAHTCTSMGGLAIAEYFEESTNVIGSAQTMGLLLRAMWRVLPGASE